MQQYYMGFDMPTGTMSIIPDSTTTKPYVKTGTTPTAILGGVIFSVIHGVSMLLIASQMF